MRKLLLLVMTLSLVAAACAGSSEETTTTAAEETTTTVAETTTSTEANTTTTAEADTTTTSGEAAEGTDQCLVGTWRFDTEAFVGELSTFFQEEMPDADVTALDGDYTVEMAADGTFTANRDGWGFAIESDQGNFTIEFNGTETGTWSADGSTLTVENQSSDIDIKATAESGGQEVELPEGQVPVETPEGIVSNNDYECSGDILTLTNSGVESTFNRS